MDTESLIQAYLLLSTEFEFGTPVNTSLDPPSFSLQGAPILDGVWLDSWSLGIPDPQFNAEVYSPGFCPSLHSTILATSLATETFHPETPIATSDIRDENLSVSNVTRPSVTSCISSKSTLGVSEGSWSALANSNEDPRDNIFAEGDWRQDGLSTNAPLDHGRLYTGIHTSHPSALSSLPDNYRVPTAVHHQEERASTEISQRSQNVGKCPSAASLRSPLQSDEGREASPSQDRYWCSICGRDYSQRRGVTRHHRDVHEPSSSCLHCSDFEWKRRHELKVHLEEQHPDIHISAALNEATRRRRTATIIKNRPPSPPLPTVLEATHDFSLAMSRAAYDPQPEPTEPTTTTRGHEYPCELASLNAAFAHVVSSQSAH